MSGEYAQDDWTGSSFGDPKTATARLNDGPGPENQLNCLGFLAPSSII
jgi:hypothetical protein